MATQRMVEFETSSDEEVRRVRAALTAPFDALAHAAPAGVDLALHLPADEATHAEIHQPAPHAC